MKRAYMAYPCPYYNDMPRYNPEVIYNAYNNYPCPCFYASDYSRHFNDPYFPFTDEIDYGLKLDSSEFLEDDRSIKLKDYGPQPFTVNINEASKQNNTFRTAIWTGEHLQVTLMSIKVLDDIGLEIHPNVDQFIRIEEGEGLVRMGKSKDRLDYQAKVYDDFAIMIPAGTWHNVINTGSKPLKVYSIYAPPQHPHGTVHMSKKEAEAAG